MEFKQFTRTVEQDKQLAKAFGCEVASPSPIKIDLSQITIPKKGGKYQWRKYSNRLNELIGVIITIDVLLYNSQSKEQFRQNYAIEIIKWEWENDNKNIRIQTLCKETGFSTSIQINKLVIAKNNCYYTDKSYSLAVGTVRSLIGCTGETVRRFKTKHIDKQLLEERYKVTPNSVAGIYALIGYNYYYIGETIHFVDRLGEHMLNYKEEDNTIISTGLAIKLDGAYMVDLLTFTRQLKEKEDKLFQHFEDIFLLSGLYLEYSKLLNKSSINTRQVTIDLEETKAKLLDRLCNMPTHSDSFEIPPRTVGNGISYKVNIDNMRLLYGDYVIEPTKEQVRYLRKKVKAVSVGRATIIYTVLNILGISVEDFISLC